MNKIISINFEIVPQEKAVVSVMDRSFLYGDSVYEVVRTYHTNQLFMLDRHYQRLLRSAERLMLSIPFSLKELETHLQFCLKKVNHGDSYIRIVVSRGADDRFHLLPSAQAKPTTVIYVDSIPELPQKEKDTGISLALVSVQRNHPKALDPSLKTGNYMNNMLALMEAQKQGAKEAIMLNQDGFITEATTSNVFMVKNGVVYTPEMRSGILEGITRSVLKEIMSKNKIPLEETMLTEEFFLSADELFITGSIKEVVPVSTINGKKIGKGIPGPITNQLIALFRESTYGARR